MESRRLAAMLTTVFACWVGMTSAAYACTGTQPVSACNSTCTANCYLHDDLNCTDGQGITLGSGFNLDVCGHVMNCTSAICYTAAVSMNGNGSKVFNTAGSGTGRFTGNWNPAINCHNHTTTKVLGIKFTNSGPSVQNCAKVENNTFVGDAPAAVEYTAGGTADTDDVVDNYFDMGYAIAIDNQIYKVTIDHNLFAMQDGGTSIGIDATGSVANLVVTNNIFMGGSGSGAPIDTSGATVSASTYTSNYCDPRNSDCATCISNGQCTSPAVPFSLP